MVFITFVPPVALVYHPKNVYPLYVGTGKSPYVLPYVTFLLDILVCQPFVLNVIVYVLAVHTAVNVVFDVGVIIAPLV